MSERKKNSIKPQSEGIKCKGREYKSKSLYLAKNMSRFPHQAPGAKNWALRQGQGCKLENPQYPKDSDRKGCGQSGASGRFHGLPGHSRGQMPFKYFSLLVAPKDCFQIPLVWGAGTTNISIIFWLHGRLEANVFLYIVGSWNTFRNFLLFHSTQYLIVFNVSDVILGAQNKKDASLRRPTVQQREREEKYMNACKTSQ